MNISPLRVMVFFFFGGLCRQLQSLQAAGEGPAGHGEEQERYGGEAGV